MNSTLLSLLMAALGQFGGLGGGPLLPGPVLPRGFAPVPAPRIRTGAELPVTTLAVVECLGRQGRIDARQARELIDLQGRRQGWPRNWPGAISRRRVAATIQGAGGCPSLLARMGGGGGIARGPSLPIPRPAPFPVPDRTAPPSSEREGFGLAPYR
ncbi:MAG: hypothetical protein VKI81_10135 [Synechococcaceae cyanobacterium]|nr:hypothetical protein [Synechococcaceae cyanobacterium]